MLLNEEILKYYTGLFFSIIALILLSTACASNMTMQTAKALPAGVFQICGAVGLLYDESGVPSQYSGRPDRDGISFLPNLWFLSRYGLGGGCDIGLNIVPYALEGNFKFQFFNSGNFYLASGIGSYYGYRPDLVDPEPGVHSWDIILPLYVSYDITTGYALYGAAKYINRYLYTKDDYNQNINRSARRHLVSFTGGFRISLVENKSFMTEICVNRDIGIRYYSAQLNAGIAKEF